MKIKPRIQQEENELVEVMDKNGKAFMYMSVAQSIKKKLPRKFVFVSIKNSHNQILLQRKYEKSKKKKQILKNMPLSGAWDIAIATNVYINESYEDAAFRAIYTQFHTKPAKLYEKIYFSSINSSDITLYTTLFTTSNIFIQFHKLQEEYKDEKEFMYAELGEIKALISHSPELFTPRLINIVNSQWI